MKYTIIRDTQEKSGYWKFNKSINCNGVMDESLDTGDYCVAGMQDTFSIERKASTGELSSNLTTKRFENELKRGNKLKHFYLVLEFSLADLMRFPYGSTIPKRIWPRLRVTPQFLLKRLIELQTKYNVQVIFAGDSDNAKVIAKAIFRRMVELYPDKVV